MSVVFTVMGQDISSYVKDWGEVEDIKEVLLSKAQLFTSEHDVVLSGHDGRFNPYRSGSMFYKKPYYQSPVTLTEDGEVLFTGFLKSAKPNKSARTVTLTIRNYLAAATDRLTSYTQTGINPVTAALAMLDAAGLSDLVNRASFTTASQAATIAGATVNVDYSSSSVAVIAAVQDLCDLAAVTVVVKEGLITAIADTPYQGSQSGLRAAIDSSNIVSIGEMQDAFNSVTNSVTLKYATSSSLTFVDQDSIDASNGHESQIELDYRTGQSIAIANSTSASYFGKLYLSRTKRLRSTIEINGSDILRGVRIGDRHPVTDEWLGLDSEPFEVIETHRKIRKRNITLILATLR